jgi:hypothetical protein
MEDSSPYWTQELRRVCAFEISLRAISDHTMRAFLFARSVGETDYVPSGPLDPFGQFSLSREMGDETGKRGDTNT